MSTSITFIKASHGFFLLFCAIIHLLILRPANPMLWLAWCAYAFVYIHLLLDNIWCLRISVLPPLALFLLTAPYVIYNLSAFLLGNPLYQDSPATIIIVVLSGLFIALPSAIVLYAYWRQSYYIFGLR